MTLEEKKEAALWAAHKLFERKEVTGSTANLSFLHEGVIYITASGSSFGTLTEDNLTCVDLASGDVLPGFPKPSKELPLHRILYLNKPGVGAVIHTHSFYSTLWSCLKHENEQDVIPQYTPYLRMKLGSVGMIPYAPPGSKELFDAFESRVLLSDGYLLANHGPVVGGKSMMDAFYIIEEFEESARVAWHLKDVPAALTIE